MVRPLVFTLHGKIYVLALLLYMDQPCFQVFDDGKWKTLPPPPFLTHLEDCAYQTLLNTRPIFEFLYAWGHKIVVCTNWGISYCFDTKTIEWEDREDVPSLKCVAEYHNFLIAKPLFSEELVVSYPRFSLNLDELKDMFLDSHISRSTDAFIIPFDDDKFCLTCCGQSDMGVNCLLHVAVFRMTISNLDGKKKLTAVLEAHQVYPFYKLVNSSFFQHICSAFLKQVLSLESEVRQMMALTRRMWNRLVFPNQLLSNFLRGSYKLWQFHFQRGTYNSCSHCHWRKTNSFYVL